MKDKMTALIKKWISLDSFLLSYVGHQLSWYTILFHIHICSELDLFLYGLLDILDIWIKNVIFNVIKKKIAED